MAEGQVGDCEGQVLATLADTPFADVDEVGVFAALQARRVRESMDWCRRNKLADYIEYSRSTATRTRRWFLTGQGIEALSEPEGVTLSFSGISPFLLSGRGRCSGDSTRWTFSTDCS